MPLYSMYCPCGYVYEGNNFDLLDHDPLEGSCCNCGGQKCMGCVFREWGHDCGWNCPTCSPEAGKL